MKYQYRISTHSNGTSNFGYAYLAIVNPSGSGRKLTLRSLEVCSHEVRAYSGTSTVFGTLYRGSSVLYGEDISTQSVAANSANSIPSTVKIKRNSCIDSYSNIVKTISLTRQPQAVGGSLRPLFGSPIIIGKRKLFSTASSVNSNVEPITIKQNEVVGLLVPSLSQTASFTTPTFRVNLSLNINDKAFFFNFYSIGIAGECVFSIENTSTNTVKIIQMNVTDIGTLDTPTLKVVPIGQMYTQNISDTPKKMVGTIKMDSSYPDISSSECLLYTDIGFIPSGTPEIAISPASAGTPAGMNYLQTRDFWGPTYRNMLVEGLHIGPGTIPTSFGTSYAQQYTDLLFRRAGITINSGEGIAIVNSAETAVAVQAAYGGWHPLSFHAQLDIEPASSPYLNISGMVTGSDIVVLTPGTSTVLTSADSIGGTTFAWNYDPDIVTAADIIVYKSGYVPFIVRNLTLGLSGYTLAVTQTVDRNYNNP